MIIVGLTGGIGTGKTVVATIFNQLGIPVYDTDIQAKRLYKNATIKSECIKIFGNNIIDKSGEVNLHAVGKMIFTNSVLLKKINSIIHPAVFDDILLWKDKNNAPYVIIESAILFESGLNLNMNKVISVVAPPEIRIRRIKERNHLTETEINDRINTQWSEIKKQALSQFIIINDGVNPIIPQVELINKKILNLK